MRADALKRQVRDLLVHATSAAHSRTTSRETLLALSEYARRLRGDRPVSPAHEPLTPYELRVFSQNGEDGVLAECLRRAQIEKGWFVEFGAGAGYENICAALADILGWSGLFIEGDERLFNGLKRKYMSNPKIQTRREMVTSANIEELFDASGVPEEPDVVTIDIDGADFWVWDALKRFRPRIVVIEYNSSLGPHRELVQPQDRSDSWDGTNYFGASIAALRRLGENRSYRLVHTDLTGTNAFFVRTDLPGEWPEADDVPVHGPNYFLLGGHHPPDPQGRTYSSG